MPIISIRHRRRRALLAGLGASIQESHPEILLAAESIAGAAGMPVTCSEEAVDNVGGRWFARTCDPAGFPNANFDADMIAAGNVGPALEMWRSMKATPPPQTLPPAPIPQTVTPPAGAYPPLAVFFDTYTPPAAPPPAATCESEITTARAYWLGLLNTYGVGGDARYTAKLNAAFAEGVTWWRSSHANYCGLYNYVVANADQALRTWIAELGYLRPGTPQTPATPPPATPQTPSATVPNESESLLDRFWKTISIGTGTSAASGTATGATNTTSVVNRLKDLPSWAWAAAAAALYLMTRNQGRRR